MVKMAANTCLHLLCLAIVSLAVTSGIRVCKNDPDITCAHDVASTFLSIHDSVSKFKAAFRGQMDVVFVVDEGALKPQQHYWTKQFIKILSEIFVISPDYTRVAVVTYSSSARVIISLASNADICSFTSNVTSMSLYSGSSYLVNGLDAAINEFKSERAGTPKLTILITNGDWGNLGPEPEAKIAQLKSLGHLAAVILKHPNQSIGLVKDVIYDYFVSFFGSKKLGFTADMTPEYLRELHEIIKHNKAVGTDWPLDLRVDAAKCTAVGRKCASTHTCQCEVRTIAQEYICVGKDEDPPEKVACNGPSSPIVITGNSTSASVTWPRPVFSDNSGVLNSITDLMPGLYIPGTYKVTATATDKNKNTATCSFSFAVSK